MAVAGLDAADRFGIGPATLSAFVAMQVVVYAAMQIPAGTLVEAIGPRWSLVLGSAAMGAGQFGFAEAESVPAAIAARVMVGCGDALIFICVLRLIASWYPESSVAWMNQATGLVGQVGALVATVPMTAALAHLGWADTYRVAGLTGLLVAMVVMMLVRDGPIGLDQVIPRRREAGLLRATAHVAEVRLGFWIHGAMSFSSITFMLIWGHPFLVEAERVSEATAGALISCGAAGLMAGSIILGRLAPTGAHHRLILVQSVIVAQVVMWSAVLLWPGRSPLVVLTVFTFLLGMCTPASFLGFDAARSAVGARGAALAIAVVNQGGFVLAVVLIVSIGVVVQLAQQTALAPGAAYSLAMLAQFPIWIWASYRIRSLGLDVAALERGN
jgi:predicted MFS family arabinose efflux permease